MNSQKVVQEHAPVSVEALVSDAVSHMDKVGYGKSTKSFHTCVWKRLVDFARQDGSTLFTEELSRSFLEMLHKFRTVTEVSTKNLYMREDCSIRMLREFSLHGCWCQRSEKKSRNTISTPFNSVLESYLLYRTEVANNRPSTLHSNERYLSRFLNYLDSNGLSDLSDLRADLISGFIASLVHLKKDSLNLVAGILRRFLRYLWVMEITTEDMTEKIPKINVPVEPHLPSFWSKEKVDALLSVVDRGSPVGKRDYAILLLACRLGMRASDIRSLRLENLQWEKSRLVIEQVKTGRPLVLPITEEVGEALIDYLKHGRRSVPYREVFLQSLAPFQPFAEGCTFNRIISSYRKKAGIPLTAARGQGLHSLRHTVACRLLEAGTSLETISEILGHASMESTRTYTRIDIATLRSAALDPEEVSNV